MADSSHSSSPEQCTAESMNGKEPALRPPFRHWGLSTRFAALHRDPTVALRPQCLRSAESGATACAARAADAGAERSDGPKGCPAPLPLWPCRGAQLQADQGRALFEPPGEFARTPPEARTAGCPEAQRRGRGQRGRPFFGTFLSATRKKGTAPPGAPPGSRPGKKQAANHENSSRWRFSAVRQTEPEKQKSISNQRPQHRPHRRSIRTDQPER